MDDVEAIRMLVASYGERIDTGDLDGVAAPLRATGRGSRAPAGSTAPTRCAPCTTTSSSTTGSRAPVTS